MTSGTVRPAPVNPKPRINNSPPPRPDQLRLRKTMSGTRVSQARSSDMTNTRWHSPFQPWEASELCLAAHEAELLTQAEELFDGFNCSLLSLFNRDCGKHEA
jgi:hypothetical protein